MSSDDVRYVNEFIDSLFPMSPEGYHFDLFLSNADVTNYNLEAISGELARFFAERQQRRAAALELAST